ncbi:hypothetical protein H072_7225 [Dactylellina haptotyla CBS 200.50]|uniref:Uncharacterized protein n=1 Tax=Dactylellina haptotyla (strain CBS 200.50) TaxID=1284197 RepID=S8BUK8_DACHA|nr:hypothetical protein H072_7225 [Dactylellina haptotyla CBS 200.50]
MKIGTTHQFSELVWFILRPQYRHNENFIEKLLKWAERIALPPKKLNFYVVRSPYIGFVSISIEMEREKDFSEMIKELDEGIRAYSLVLSDERSTFEAPWLEESDEERLKKIQRPNKRQYTEAEGGLDQKSGLVSSPLMNRRKESSFIHANSSIPTLRTKRYVANKVAQGTKLPASYYDLKALSQPPGVKISDLAGRFWNFKNPGQNTVIYMLDTGYDLQHPELENIKVQDWLDPYVFPWDEQNDINRLYPYHGMHGTSVLSKCAGRTVGVSQAAAYVLVRYIDGRVRGNYDTFADALVQIYDHIRSRNSDKKCVLNIAARFPVYIGTTKTQFEAQRRLHMEDIFIKLAGLPNLIIVTGAGNAFMYERNSESYPSVFADHFFIGQKMVVVAGYHPWTGHEVFPGVKETKVWAPAARVSTACWYLNGSPTENKYKVAPTDFDKKRQICYKEGISYGIPLVSGLLANWLSSGIDTDLVINYMYRLAYPRADNGPAVLYNGIKIQDWPREFWPNWYKKNANRI